MSASIRIIIAPTLSGIRRHHKLIDQEATGVFSVIRIYSPLEEEPMHTTAGRTKFAVAAGFIIGLIIQIINGLPITTSLVSAAFFAVFVGVSVAILSWAGEYAERRGYPFWVGFLLVFFLNLIGVVILLLLPLKLPQRDM